MVLCLLILFDLVVGSCTSDQIEIITKLKSSNPLVAQVFSIYHVGQQTPLYTSGNTPSSNVITNTVCLPRNTNLQYDLLMASNGNSWYTYSWVALYGIYGNLVFKGFYCASRVQVSFYTPILMDDSWKYSTSLIEDWNKVNFIDSSWQTYTGDVYITSSTHMFFRKSFTIPDNQVAYEIMLYYQFGILVYMNGEEVLRDNLPLGTITTETACTAYYPSFDSHRLIRSSVDLSSSNTLSIELVLPSFISTVKFKAYLATFTSDFPSSYNLPCHVLDVTDTTGPSSYLFDWDTAFSVNYQGYTCFRLNVTNAVSFEISQVRFVLPHNNTTPQWYSYKWLSNDDPYSSIFRYISLTFKSTIYTDFFINDHYRKQSRVANFCYEADGMVSILEIIPYVCSLPTITFLSYGIQPYLLVVNETVSITPTATNNFVNCHASNDDLPPGLSVDNQGVISGIPLFPQNKTGIQISCYNTTAAITSGIDIEIRSPYATCSYLQQSYVLAKNVPFSTTPEISAINPSFEVIAGSLPTGLLLNSTSGTIEGIATVYQDSLNITIEMTAGIDIVTIVLAFKVIEGPTIQFSESSVVTLIQVPFSITPTVAGDSVQLQCLSSLPQGLSFNTQTGEISGTPTEGSFHHEIIIEVSNESGAVQASLFLSIQLLTSMCTYDDITFLKSQVSEYAPTGCDSFMTFSLYQGTLPTGLTLNTTTGHITGIPTQATETSVIIQITNQYGSIQRTVSITISLIPLTSFSYNQQYFILYQNRPISYQPIIEGEASSFTILEGTLPEGISLNPLTGFLTGSCLSIYTNIPITIQVSNSLSSLNTTLYLSCEQAINTFMYSDSPFSLAIDISYTITPPSIIIASPFTLESGSLPSGLSFNPITGIITGSPSSLTSLQSVIITYNNTSCSLVFVVEESPSFSYPQFHYHYNMHDQISIIPSIQGQIVTFSLHTGSLQPNLSIHPSLGTITGTIAANGNTTAIIRCSNGAGVFTTSISFSVLSPPSYFNYSSFIFNVAVDRTFTISPLIDCTDCIFTILNSPVLPAGVSFNTVSGSFYGTPSVDQQGGNYSITASNAVGSLTTSISLEVWLQPANFYYSEISYYYMRNERMTMYPYYDGRGVMFSIKPPLPAGITLSALTGVISGTPTASRYNQEYTITCTNPVGSISFTHSFSVLLPISRFSYSSNEYFIYLNEAIALSPTVIGDFPRYTITSSVGLPKGLILDSYSGVIRGILEEEFETATITINCSNGYSSISTHIAFYYLSPPQSFSYPASSYSFTVGKTVSITPKFTSSSHYFAIVYGTLPSGLSLEAMNGVIKGTVNEVTEPEEIHIIIYNDKGSLSDIIMIEVVPKSYWWIIIVVVVVIGLGIGGYYIWTHRKTKKQLPIKKLRSTIYPDPPALSV